jgi:DNA-binding MarR family transcriptional regulator
LLQEVRLADERLTRLQEALCADLGLTRATGGVLLAFAGTGAQTVPQIARVKSVTRQHAQALVDKLWERGLCQFTPNPNHARSPLVELTTKGLAMVETLQEGEHATITELAAGLTMDVSTALAVLRRLNASLLRRL